MSNLNASQAIVPFPNAKVYEDHGNVVRDLDEKGRVLVSQLRDRELLEEIATRLREAEDSVTELFESAKDNPMFRMLLP